jgi:AcrR family transcriptional regulator
MSIRHTPPGASEGDAPDAAASGSDQSTDALLDAARDNIAAVGWRRTTLTDVARRAGVSRMTIYRRWPDMQSLLADLLVREWDALLGVTPVAEDGAISPTTLAASVTAVVRALREEPLLARIIEVDPELLLPYLLVRRGRNQDHLLELLADAVARGQAAGAIRSGDAALIARGVVLAAQGFVLSAPTMTDSGIDGEALDAELQHLVESHLRP